MSHTRRNAAMDAEQAARIASLEEKCAGEIEELKGKQKTEYDVLVSMLSAQPAASKNGTATSPITALCGARIHWDFRGCWVFLRGAPSNKALSQSSQP